jgi:phage baseplate assembly protein W
MGLIYGAGLQPLMILVNLPPGALPQSSMKRAFGASSLWKMIDRPLPKCANSSVRSNRPDLPRTYPRTYCASVASGLVVEGEAGV